MKIVPEIVKFVNNVGGIFSKQEFKTVITIEEFNFKTSSTNILKRQDQENKALKAKEAVVVKERKEK